MYCKNCGNQIDANAKFCDSCGAAVAQQPQQQAPQQQNYTAPRPFHQNSVDESQNYQYQKSAFKGAQTSVGTSGHVSFGSQGQKKRSLIGRLLRFGIVVVALTILYFVFFGSDISNVEMGTGLDTTTNTIIGESDTFAANTPEIYILFNFNYEPGATLGSEWYDADDALIGSASIVIPEDVNIGYFYLEKPTTGNWALGEYTVNILVDGEIVHTEYFTIE